VDLFFLVSRFLNPILLSPHLYQLELLTSWTLCASRSLLVPPQLVRARQFLCKHEYLFTLLEISDNGSFTSSSTVVDYLCTTFRSETECTAYIYCSHQDHKAQTPVNLVASILRQIILSSHRIPDSLNNLYRLHNSRSTRPSLEEVSSILGAEVEHFDRVFVVLDALDECAESNGCRDLVLSELAKLKRVNIMVTSRPHVGIGDFIDSFVRLDIRADDEDLCKYVDGCIDRNPRLIKHIKEHTGLREDIRSTIVRRARGMFVVSVS